ncbi:MAG: Fe2+-dependent dioxygenase [Kiloniellales bacterium]
MLLRIPNFLQPGEVTALRQQIDAIQTEDGSVSGNPNLKQNRQLTGANPAVRPLLDEVQRRLFANQEFVSFALPLHMSVAFNRYDPGMFYQFHSDAAIMGSIGQQQPLRTDLSITISLSSEQEYEGGEFHIRTPYGEMTLKEAAGTLICYPSNMPHRVEAIRQGQRISAIGWVQSLLRSPEKREIVQQLGHLHRAVTANDPNHPQDQAFGQLRNNLLRMWSET